MNTEARKVWKEKIGKVPEGLKVFHINGDEKDLRLNNLELVSRGMAKKIRHAAFGGKK